MADEQTPKPAETPAPKTPEPEPEPISTRHKLTLGEQTFSYTATAGRLPIKNAETGEPEAHIFFTAYTLDADDHASRPLIFVFNGGPGSASVWLHLGALGPQRVKMQDEGWMPAPPFCLEPNAHTWLDVADLVFVDPVGTGYSRAVKAEDSKKYWNLQGDFESLGEFIRLYLTRYERWASPLFLTGESYGTTRSAGLAGYLVDRGIAFNGLLLISTVLNFQTLDFDIGNDLPYAVFTPTYTATAWYHGRLAAELQARPLRDVLAEVEAWADDVYARALARGRRLTEAERSDIAAALARYTGLSVDYVERANLRINIFAFCKELLRDRHYTVGRLDSRFKGRDALQTNEQPEYDPSLSALMPPYTAMINSYLRGALGYKTDLAYELLSFKVNGSWEWDRGRYPDTSDALRGALARNPYMRIFLGMGLYDLATPHFATAYTLHHMNLHPDVQDNFTLATYEAGHMFYLDVRELARLKADAAAFIAAALG